MFETFNQHNFYELCDYLASKDQELASVLAKYGYPPFWTRPNTFESLVHIILEQQVSLASALAAMQKLKAKIGAITPANFLTLKDEELKACYFSRQKAVYVRDLAEKISNGQLDLLQLEILPDDEIRDQLKKVKGIGDWTADIYLIFILHHTDVFPTGDLAAVNALKSLKNIAKDKNKDELLSAVADWKPFRTIGLMMIWHYYLEERKPANKKKFKKKHRLVKPAVPFAFHPND